MSRHDVTVVRIYLGDDEALAQSLLRRLHDWEHLSGVTVFRGLAGFGPGAPLPSLSGGHRLPEEPLVIEFYDEPDKVARTLEHLADQIKPGHMISFSAVSHH